MRDVELILAEHGVIATHECLRRDSYQAIVQVCRTAWHLLINDPERISSIGSGNWPCVSL